VEKNLLVDTQLVSCCFRVVPSLVFRCLFTAWQNRFLFLIAHQEFKEVWLSFQIKHINFLPN